MKKLTLFLLSLVIGFSWATAQNRTVKGTVISSEDNLPIIGANVVVVGQTTIGAATNIDGEFTLSVPASAKKLKFSSIGMKELILDIQPIMNVTMHPDRELLDAVVVIGYGTGQKLGTVSGSVARVSSEKLENKPVANVMDALQGQVSGMHVQTTSGDPNAVASVEIHGNASLGASSAPLYIVDGVQTSASVVMAMNQNDIETFTVLKDASSTSIYGARAANGVIVITTKKGKRNQDGKINVNALYGVSTLISDRPMRQMMSGQEHLDYILKHLDPRDVKPYLKGLKGTNFDGTWDEKTGEATVYESHDWLKAFMGKKAPTYQADLSVSGGSQNTSYYLSGGFFSQEGISVSKSKYQKFNLRSSFDARVKEWLRIGTSVSGGIVNSLVASGFDEANVNAGVFGALVLPRFYNPHERIVDENGNVSFSNKYADIVRIHRSYPLLKGTLYMPEYLNQFSDVTNRTIRLNASGYAQVTPIEGLTLKSQLGVDYSLYNGTARIYHDNPYTDGTGSARRSFDNGYTMTWTNTGEYKWKADDINNFTFLLGHEYVSNKDDGFSAMGRGMISRNFMFIQMGQKGSFLVPPSEFVSEYAYLSFFGRVNYNFKNWLSADVTLRHDRSSRFGSKHLGATFFSVGVLYDVYNAWLADNKKINEKISSLRVKANYGTQGNSAISLYAPYALTGTINYTDRLAFGVTSIGNPDLGWEKQGMLSLTAEAGFFKEMLTVAVNYYNRKTTDMLMNVPLPYSTGYTSRWENVGAMTNQGFDVDINYNFLQLKDWNAYFRTQLNYNFERIDKLFSERTNREGWIVGEYIYRTGHNLVFYLPRFAGYSDEGKQLFYLPDENGRPTEETTSEYSDKIRMAIDEAPVTPPFNGGFSLGANFKKMIFLDTDFSFSVGGHTLNNDRYFIENNVEGFTELNRSKKLLNEWTEDNKENAQANKFNEPMVFDNRLIENTSYLRLKNVTLSFVLPQAWLKKVKGVSNVKVYFTGRNLLTFVHSSFNGFDPETTGGITMNRFPATRQYVGGIQLSF